MAFWHGRILPATYYFRDRGIVVITSENFDGEWIARIIQRFGYGTARGSTSRGGARALRAAAARRSDAGQAGGVHRRRPARAGARRAAGRRLAGRATGNPVLPFHLEAARHWTAPSWDARRSRSRSARVGVVVGEPLWVPERRRRPRCWRPSASELERMLADARGTAPWNCLSELR